MRFIFTLEDIDLYMDMPEKYITKIKEDIHNCSANSYAEAEEKAFNYFWQQHKADKEYIYHISFDAFCDAHYMTEDLISIFGEADGQFLKHLHEKYDRESLYNCEIYYFDTSDKGKLDPEDKIIFANLGENTYKILHNLYISTMLNIIKMHGYNYNKYKSLADIANYI